MGEGAVIMAPGGFQKLVDLQAWILVSLLVQGGAGAR